MQPELFEGLEASPRRERPFPPLFPHRYLRVRVAYEDLVFGILSSLLILLAGFCLGVERGKQLGVHSPVVTPTPSVAVASSELKSPPEVISQVPRPVGSYAIQLASYLDLRSAESEAQRLRRRGLEPRVVKQGRYFELRVVGYRSREEAVSSLALLKKMYHDGFVKRIS